MCINFFLPLSVVKAIGMVPYLSMPHKTAKLIQEALIGGLSCAQFYSGCHEHSSEKTMSSKGDGE